MKHKRKNSDDFMKKIIITMALFLLIFTIVVLYMFAKTSTEPSTLILAVFGACLGEGSICGYLKKQKYQERNMEDESDGLD